MKNEVNTLSRLARRWWPSRHALWCRWKRSPGLARDLQADTYGFQVCIFHIETPCWNNIISFFTKIKLLKLHLSQVFFFFGTLFLFVYIFSKPMDCLNQLIKGILQGEEVIRVKFSFYSWLVMVTQEDKKIK